MAIQIKPILNAEQIAAASSINQDNLTKEFSEHAANVYYYAAKRGDAARQEMRAKQYLELISARVDADIRLDAASVGEKVTEVMVANKVKMDETFQAAQAAFNDAAFIHSLAVGATLAMATKRDMLIQLGANEREQIKGNLRMLEGNNPIERAQKAFTGSKQN